MDQYKRQKRYSAKSRAYFARQVLRNHLDGKEISQWQRRLYAATKDLQRKATSLDVDYHVGKFWVVKTPHHLKGTKRFAKRPGETYRDILYLKDKTLRELLTGTHGSYGDKRTSPHSVVGILDQPIALLSGTTHQYGFTRGRSILDKIPIVATTDHHLELDLENAFDGISYAEVYHIFRIVADLNREDAHYLAGLATHNGWMYQGSPLAPILFNIAMLPIMETLNRIPSILAISYADDITIVSEKRFGWGFRRWIRQVFNTYGRKINEKKTRFTHRTHKKTLGFSIQSVERHPQGSALIVSISIARSAKYFKRKLKKLKPHSIHKGQGRTKGLYYGYKAWVEVFKPPGHTPGKPFYSVTTYTVANLRTRLKRINSVRMRKAPKQFKRSSQLLATL